MLGEEFSDTCANASKLRLLANNKAANASPMRTPAPKRLGCINLTLELLALVLIALDILVCCGLSSIFLLLLLLLFD